MLINLIPHMTYFITTLLLMAVSVLTKVNFLKLEDLCMWLTWSNCASHAHQFDTTYDLLHHYSNPHGNVRAHQGQLLEVGELVHVTNLVSLRFSCWLFWCPTWHRWTLLCISLNFLMCTTAPPSGQIMHKSRGWVWSQRTRTRTTTTTLTTTTTTTTRVKEFHIWNR